MPFYEHVHGIAPATAKATKSQTVTLHRKPAHQTGADAAPASVHQTLRAPGRPLDTATQRSMSSRFGHDFSQVRVHTDVAAAASAQAVNARAYTVGQDVVFDAGHYAPGTSSGQRLLAHELTHVVQQAKASPVVGAGLQIGASSSEAEREADQAASQVLEGRAVAPANDQHSLGIQRDDGPQSGEEETKLRWPGMGQQPSFQLHLDPEIEAQLAAMRAMQLLLTPETVRTALFDFDLSTLLATPPSLLTLPSPQPAKPPVAPPQPAKPLVPPGKGPDEPRPAKGGDLFKAILAVPAVGSALTDLRTQATSRLRSDWRGLSTGEQVVVVTGGAFLTGGLLGGVLSDPDARQFSLGLIQNKPLPVPYLPGLTFQFNLTGPNQSVQFGLDVGRFLPSSLGFGKKK